MNPSFRWLFGVIIFGWILSVGPASAARAASRPVQVEGGNRAALVVQAADGSVATACVAFTEEQFSGYDLLQRSGMPVVASFDAMGAAVCSINGQGCAADNCFCQFPPNYWSYWRLSGGSWSYSTLGASAAAVHNGDVDGWSWGSGKPPAAAPSFDSICGAVEAQPSPTVEVVLPPPTVPPTLEPTQTAWIEPSATPAPTWTEAPTLTAVPTASSTPLQTLAINALRLTLTATRPPARADAGTLTPAVSAPTGAAASASVTAPALAALDSGAVTLPAVHGSPTDAAALAPTAARVTVFPSAAQTPSAGGVSPDLLGLAGFMILAGGLVGLLAFFWMKRS